MRVRLDERAIRSIVRQSIARRLLNELDQSGADQVPTLDLLGLLRGGEKEAGAESSAGKGEPKSKYLPSGRKRGDDAALAINTLVKGNVELSEEGAVVLDGAAIKTFLDKRGYIKRPFRVTDSSKVMEEWRSSASRVPSVYPIGSDGKPDTSKEQIEFTPDLDGLLRYLIAVKGAEMGAHVLVTEISAAKSDYQLKLKPIVTDLVGKFSELAVDENDLVEVAEKVLGVLKEDETPRLTQTKTLLAGFAGENATTYEALEPVAWAVGALLVAYFVIPAAFSAAVGGAVGATLGVSLGAATSATAALTAFAGYTALTLALGAGVVWGLSEAAESAFANWIETPPGQVAAHINDKDQSFLNELALEVERVWFLTSPTLADWRDRLGKTLRKISMIDPNKAEIVSELTDLISEISVDDSAQ